MRTEQLQREFGVQLRHTVFPLHPEIPQPGIELAELFAGRGYDLEASFERLRQVAAELALPLARRTRSYNSRRAQELGKWAESLGRGDAFRAAVYQAYFVSGRNIAKVDELVSLAAGLGLDAEQARQVLQQKNYAGAVDADWQRAKELGVTAVPTFSWHGQTLVGFTSYATLRQLVGV